MCDKGLIWNPSNCECKCNKLCDDGEYLDYKNCQCRKRLIDKLVEECRENIDGSKIIYNSNLKDYGKICNFCVVCIVLLAIFFIIILSLVFKKKMYWNNSLLKI